MESRTSKDRLQQEVAELLERWFVLGREVPNALAEAHTGLRDVEAYDDRED